MATPKIEDRKPEIFPSLTEAVYTAIYENHYQKRKRR